MAAASMERLAWQRAPSLAGDVAEQNLRLNPRKIRMVERSQTGSRVNVSPTYTRKQMGDACEMLVAAELTLAGIPALKVPDNWPGYDVIAQPLAGEPQRISVKSRTFKRGPAYVEYNKNDTFDWLAVVLLAGDGEPIRRIFLIPRTLADKKARKNKPTTKHANQRYWSLQEFPKLFAAFESNFTLSANGSTDRPQSAQLKAAECSRGGSA